MFARLRLTSHGRPAHPQHEQVHAYLGTAMPKYNSIMQLQQQAELGSDWMGATATSHAFFSSNSSATDQFLDAVRRCTHCMLSA